MWAPVCARISNLLKEHTRDRTLLVEGWVLYGVLLHHLSKFAGVCQLVQTAIFYSTAPIQKGQLVSLVKGFGVRTLAVGDGANDVRTIQEAHVGAGISGREGLQAARSADYSIAKFKYMPWLSLIHRWHSYLCTSFIAQNSIYKSLALCFSDSVRLLLGAWQYQPVPTPLSLSTFTGHQPARPCIPPNRDLADATVVEPPRCKGLLGA